MGEPSPAVYMFRERFMVDDAVLGWLGDEFPPDLPLYCLCLEVPQSDIPPPAGPFGTSEAVFAKTLPPSWIVSCQRI